MFKPLRTARLMLRPVRPDDALPLKERRNDPAVARYQDWSVPFAMAQAEQIVAGAAMTDGPVADQWWMLTISDLGDTVVLGDLALRLTCQGRSAEIGYSLDPAHWDHGYATEAVAALIGWLFEVQGVTRVQATLHPDNLASALVLERTGFLFEGNSRLASWVGDINSDDHVYAIIRTDWEAWRSRPSHAPTTVALVELTEANVVGPWRLQTHKSQERFVAPMLASFGQALFPEVIDGAPVVPWMRGVVGDDQWVAFVMLTLVTDQHPEPYLWRLLVDRQHQRRGIGSRAIDLVVDELRLLGAETLLTSWTEGRGSPRAFYERYGFVPTGELDDGETEARLRFV